MKSIYDDEKIQSNYDANKVEIDAAFERMKDDMNQKHTQIGMFTAGLELSNIVYLLTDASFEDNNNLLQLSAVTNAGGLLVGVFEQLVYLNRFDGLIDCAMDTKEAVAAAEKVWQDMQAGKEAKAMADLISAKSAFSSAVKQCKTEATDEALLMVEFIERTFSSKEVLVQTVSDNSAAHPE